MDADTPDKSPKTSAELFQEASRLRIQAREIREAAAYADGPAYYSELSRAEKLLTEAAWIHRDAEALYQEEQLDAEEDFHG